MKRYWAAAGCIVISIVMMAYGAFRGEAAAVLKKAIVLCLECIGIG